MTAVGAKRSIALEQSGRQPAGSALGNHANDFLDLLDFKRSAWRCLDPTSSATSRPSGDERGYTDYAFYGDTVAAE